MFITYLTRELRRRMRQTIFIALGLALGVGLVITVMAASNGVSATQGTVLKSLYGVGTDVTVTQPPTAGSGGGQRFNFQGTDSGQKGTNVNRDILAGGGFGTIKSSAVTTVSEQKDVTAAVGSLTLNDVDLSGTFSQSGGSGGTGGTGGQGAGGGPSGALSTSSFSVSGVNPSNDSLGPLSSAVITSGHAITTAEANDNVAVVDSDYAKSENLKTGSTITVAGKSFTVVGIVAAAQGVTDADVYIPLARAQSLANMPNEVNTIYVSAASASDIGAVSSEISKALPAATVTTSSDLASEVTGSLSSASTLANNLGKWLAVAVLAAAFLMASILTMSAVTRRVREFGTLKAIGWSSRRIIRQASAAHTVSVHLTAPVTLGAVGLAVVLAIIGGLVAGMVGGWRAARLRTAAALSRLA